MLLGRHSEPGMVLSQVAIQEAKLGDHPAALVGKQRKPDSFGSRKVVQDCWRVVADADQPDPPPL